MEDININLSGLRNEIDTIITDLTKISEALHKIQNDHGDLSSTVTMGICDPQSRPE